MPRVISFIVLLAILLLVGAIFFQVMAQFIVPLFLACVLLVVFQPLHARILRQSPRHPRICALITTVLILLVVLLPLTWLGWNAYGELHSLFVSNQENAAIAAEIDPAPEISLPVTAPMPEVGGGAATEGITVAPPPEGEFTKWLSNTSLALRDDLSDMTGIRIDDATLKGFVNSSLAFVGTKLLRGVQTILNVLIGLAIMVISLYYFLADGPAMIRTAMHLSPLDTNYEKELLERFGEVSRAVVVATLLSAVVQGALAGVGYALALPKDAPIFLLTALTMVTAMVPFVGAAAVWVCVCGWVYLYGERIVDGVTSTGDPVTAIILAIYCAIVVSGIDNVIKPFILHGQSRLHPLLALLSILGGVQVLGPVGILVGPMLVSFLQALLNMLRRELDSFGGVSPSKQLASMVEQSESIAAEENGASVGDAKSAKAPAPAAAKPTKRGPPKRKPGR